MNPSLSPARAPRECVEIDAKLGTTDSDTAARMCAGDAVGVSDRKWYVAIVNNNTERASALRLAAQGLEAYVASQEETRVWKNGRKKKVERVLLPSLVFMRCTEAERLEAVKLPFINRFMTNRAGASTGTGRSPLATIPQAQMERLQFMLRHADGPVSIIDTPLERGDKVKVARGSLAGLQGEVIDAGQGNGRLLVNIGLLGCATLVIPRADLEANA